MIAICFDADCLLCIVHRTSSPVRKGKAWVERVEGACVVKDRSQWVPDRIDRDHGVREGESLLKEPVREEHLAVSSMDNRFAQGDHIIQCGQDNGKVEH